VFWRIIVKLIKKLIRMIRRMPEEPSLEPELDEIQVVDAASAEQSSKDE
jgi:hypothetical protein